MTPASDDSQKLSKTVARRIKKVATGPLLGPIQPTPQEERPPEPVSVSRLGNFQDVQARIAGSQAP